MRSLRIALAVLALTASAAVAQRSGINPPRQPVVEGHMVLEPAAGVVVRPAADPGMAFNTAAPMAYQLRLQGGGQATLWAEWLPAVQLDAKLTDDAGNVIAAASGAGWLMATCVLPQDVRGARTYTLGLTPAAGGRPVTGTFHVEPPESGTGWMTDAELDGQLREMEAQHETIRNQRQKQTNQFEDVNQRTNHMMQMLASILKTMGEMRMGAVNNIR